MPEKCGYRKTPKMSLHLTTSPFTQQARESASVLRLLGERAEMMGLVNAGMG